MLRALVQEHSLRKLYLGDNKFTVDTIPEVVGTMTKLEALDLGGLGYTGKSGTSPVMSLITSLFPQESFRWASFGGRPRAAIFT
jgi:hypothetical protein